MGKNARGRLITPIDFHQRRPLMSPHTAHYWWNVQAHISDCVPRLMASFFPPESVGHNSCVCTDILHCKCQFCPIKRSSDATAHKGIPLIKSSIWWKVDGRHCRSTDVCCITAGSCVWFSWVMSVLLFNPERFWPPTQYSIFTTISVRSLQCWLHFDYWLLYLLSSTHLILHGKILQYCKWYILDLMKD